MTEKPIAWIVQRLELLYFNHEHKWQLFQQQTQKAPDARGEAAQQARFRQQIAGLLESMAACLRASEIPLPEDLAAEPILSSGSVKKLVESNQQLDAIVKNHVTFLQNAGLDRSSENAITLFLKSLLTCEDRTLNRSQILDLISIITLDKRWEIPVLFLPDYILSLEDNRDPRNNPEVKDFLGGQWRQFYLQSLEFENRCTPPCSHVSCKRVGKRIRTAFSSPKACEGGSTPEFSGFQTDDYHSICLPEKDPPDASAYKFYVDVVDSAWIALDDGGSPLKNAFLVAYPLEVLGHIHILLIHIRPDNPEARIDDLANFWHGWHTSQQFGSCARFIAQQAEAIDITAFQWRLGNKLVRDAGNQSPIVGNLLWDTFQDLAKHAFHLQPFVNENGPNGAVQAGSPKQQPGDIRSNSVIDIDGRPMARILGPGNLPRSVRAMRNEYIRKIVIEQWKWALSFAEMPAELRAAWVENPQLQREEILLQAIARATVQMRAEDRNRVAEELADGENVRVWDSDCWIPPHAEFWTDMNSPVGVFGTLTSTRKSEMRSTLAKIVKKEFRALVGEPANCCLLKHVQNMPDESRSYVRKWLPAWEFEVKTDELKNLLLTKVPEFKNLGSISFNANAFHNLSRDTHVTTFYQKWPSTNDPKFASVKHRSSFDLDRQQNWGELGGCCGVYWGDILHIDYIADLNCTSHNGTCLGRRGSFSVCTSRKDTAQLLASTAVFEWSNKMPSASCEDTHNWFTTYKDRFESIGDDCQKLDSDKLQDVIKIVLFRYGGKVALWNQKVGLLATRDGSRVKCEELKSDGPAEMFILCCAIGDAVDSIEFNSGQVA